jgi:hypothetical protein
MIQKKEEIQISTWCEKNIKTKLSLNKMLIAVYKVHAERKTN